LDRIRQAIELARSRLPAQGDVADPFAPFPASSGVEEANFREARLNKALLESKRIVAHDFASQGGRYYDMLRTQVLQAMDHSGWHILAITSGTAGCGKTVTACNLAMSIARLAERSVLLVDMDLHKPKVADYLGLDARQGLLSVLKGDASLSSAIVRTSIGENRMLVLPGEVNKSGSAEWMASQAMTNCLQALRRDFRSQIIIVDLPPVLVGDDVITLLPQIDSVLLIASVGASTLSDIKECYKHIRSTPIVRVVVNKVSEKSEGYYGYY
jgi:capsular exopolysaccharide synthesis family protein